MRTPRAAARAGAVTVSEPPHPLAKALVQALAGRSEPARVLLLGVGSGRNVPPLVAAGAYVDAVEQDPERALAAAQRFAATPRTRVARAPYAGPYPFSFGYDGALSTHALLHGTRASAAAGVAAARNRLREGAPFFLTLGSTADPRFGTGLRIEESSWAPADGSEAGVPHLYLDEPGARELLAGFDVRSLVESSAAETAGRWAHDEAEAMRLVHWFVEAHKR